MKNICPFSGIRWEAPFFSQLSECSIPHPFLSSPNPSKVIGSLLPSFGKNLLSQEELHLFGTYLVLQLPVESWNFPLLSGEHGNFFYWEPFWLKHLEELAGIVLRLNGKTPKNLASFVISKAGLYEGIAPLGNLGEWIRTAHLTCDEYYSPISPEAHKRNKLFRKNLSESESLSESQVTAIIEKGLRGSILSPKEKEKFPSLVADWAAKVGDFPNSFFQNEIGEKQTVREFWKGIIKNAFDLGANGRGYNAILTSDVSIADLEELIEHCAENIPHSTLHSRALYEQLGKLKEVILEFRPSVTAANLSVQILSSEDIASIMAEHVSPVVISKNPENDDPLMPRKEDYPTLSSFLAAKKSYKAKKTSESLMEEQKEEMK